ncbi:MAG: SDR family NAD(P)-dependent oxidoreductase [Deltaproteobacteria bacterium]
MPTEELKGRIALVTGGGRGIGRAIAVGLAKAGVDVAVNYLSHEKEAGEVCEMIKAEGCRAVAVQADVSVAASVSRMAGAVQEHLGPVSILVNNAGIARARRLDEIDERLWDETIAVNLKSCFLVTQAVLPGMRARHWGRIINISSVAAHTGGIVGPHYAASKAGILGLTHSYASLLIKEGITVNAIAPALIITDMVSEATRARAGLIPVGRLGTVKEVADVALMLAENGYMSGQTINVDGGLYFS